MNVSDWVLAAALLLAVLYGWRLGTINVVGKVGALLLGYWAARKYSALLAAYLVQAVPSLTAGNESSEQLLSFLSLFVNTDSIANRLIQLAAFVVIFVVVCWVIKRIAYALTGIFGRGLLGSINRTLGAAVALIFALLLIVILDDIVFPALSGMGLGVGAEQFMASSRIILPLIKSVQALV